GQDGHVLGMGGVDEAHRTGQGLAGLTAADATAGTGIASGGGVDRDGPEARQAAAAGGLGGVTEPARAAGGIVGAGVEAGVDATGVRGTGGGAGGRTVALAVADRGVLLGLAGAALGLAAGDGAIRVDAGAVALGAGGRGASRAGGAT